MHLQIHSLSAVAALTGLWRVGQSHPGPARSAHQSANVEERCASKILQKTKKLKVLNIPLKQLNQTPLSHRTSDGCEGAVAKATK